MLWRGIRKVVQYNDAVIIHRKAKFSPDEREKTLG